MYYVVIKNAIMYMFKISNVYFIKQWVFEGVLKSLCFVSHSFYYYYINLIYN